MENNVYVFNYSGIYFELYLDFQNSTFIINFYDINMDNEDEEIELSNTLKGKMDNFYGTNIYSLYVDYDGELENKYMNLLFKDGFTKIKVDDNSVSFIFKDDCYCNDVCDECSKSWNLLISNFKF